MAYWWDGLNSERFWCEITHRPDIGADLKCPQFKTITDDGTGIVKHVPYWSYGLINEVRPGDVVFHYSGQRHAFVGASVAGGPVEERPIVWTARGASARARRPSDEPKPGWWLPIYGFQKLEHSLTLSELTKPGEVEWIRNWIDDGQRKWGKTYAALMPYKETIRGAQGYLTKLPREWVERWSKLARSVQLLGSVTHRIEEVVRPSVVLPPTTAVRMESALTLSEVLRPHEPTVAEDGARGGGRLRSSESKKVGDRAEQLVFEAIAALATASGLTSLRWVAREGEKPGWDIEYRDATGELVCVEVKGTTAQFFPSVELTSREWAAAREHRARYQLHLVACCDTVRPRHAIVSDPFSLVESGAALVEPTVWRLSLMPSINEP